MSHRIIEDAAPTDAPAVPFVNVNSFDEFVAIRENRGAPSLSTWCPEITPVRGTGPFTVDYRSAAVGSMTFHDVNFGCAVRMHGDGCSHYHVAFRVPDAIECPLPDAPIGALLGDGVVHRPDGKSSVSGWVGRKLDMMVERDVVDAALSDALGRSVRTQVEFATTMPANTSAARTWMTMASLLSEHVFRPDSVLTQPIVGLPFVDSLVRGLLLAVEHPYRAELQSKPDDPAPPAIRTAVEIIEAEAERPLTVSEIAGRSHLSARALQLGFRQHLGTTPMSYLRDVRLRRAHQELLESDPSVDMVSRIAYRWGFRNTGRFAAAHAARYGESPAVTLRRTPNDARRGRSRYVGAGRATADAKLDGVRAG
jgi:AraC-like DNA-binding protein